MLHRSDVAALAALTHVDFFGARITVAGTNRLKGTYSLIFPCSVFYIEILHKILHYLDVTKALVFAWFVLLWFCHELY